MAKKQDLRQVKVSAPPKAPGKTIISYDQNKMRQGASEKKMPMPTDGMVKGGK
jgi:hypothetical protein